eukprot:scaffold649909_cov50-Prasinocladus_malaysianus.AAC.1
MSDLLKLPKLIVHVVGGCSQWLSARVGDKRVMRTLYAGRLAKATGYLVTVFTSDLKGAGTDANVHL